MLLQGEKKTSGFFFLSFFFHEWKRKRGDEDDAVWINPPRFPCEQDTRRRRLKARARSWLLSGVSPKRETELPFTKKKKSPPRRAMSAALFVNGAHLAGPRRFDQNDANIALIKCESVVLHKKGAWPRELQFFFSGNKNRYIYLIVNRIGSCLRCTWVDEKVM